MPDVTEITSARTSCLWFSDMLGLERLSWDVDCHILAQRSQEGLMFGERYENGYDRVEREPGTAKSDSQ